MIEINPKGIGGVGFRNVAESRRSKNVSKTPFSETLSDTSPAVTIDASANVQTSHGVMGVDALFLAIETSKSPKEQEILRGESLLDRLDHIRLGLITGEIPRQTLDELANLSHSPLADHKDPRLKEIILEIETRAKVEMAKLEKYS